MCISIGREYRLGIFVFAGIGLILTEKRLFDLTGFAESRHIFGIRLNFQFMENLVEK